MCVSCHHIQDDFTSKRQEPVKLSGPVAPHKRGCMEHGVQNDQDVAVFVLRACDFVDSCFYCMMLHPLNGDCRLLPATFNSSQVPISWVRLGGLALHVTVLFFKSTKGPIVSLGSNRKLRLIIR